MEGLPLGPAGEDITWPDQVAPRPRKASSTRKIEPQTSNLTLMLASVKNIRRGTTSINAVPASWLLNLDRLRYDWLLTMMKSTRKPKNTRGVFPA